MANIQEILARAASLRDETQLNSINPERAGGIMYDTLIALNELWLSQGAALVISKIYASVAAMQADTSPVSDLSGRPLLPGQIVVIASSDSDNGKVYRYNGAQDPSWSLVGEIGNLVPVDNLESDSTSLPLAARQGKVLDGKVSQLGQEVDGLNNAYSTTIAIQPTTVLHGYLAGGIYYDTEVYRVTVYKLNAGKKATLQASVIFDRDTLDFAVLFNSIPSDGTSGQVLVTPVISGTTVNEDITPPTDCYLGVLTKMGTQDLVSSISVTEAGYTDFQSEIEQNAEEIQVIKDDVEDLDIRVSHIEDGEQEPVLKDISDNNEARLNNAWIYSVDGSIGAYSGSFVRAYKVNKGDKVRATGVLSNSPIFCFMAFFPGETAPAIGNSATVLVPYGDTDKNEVDYEYTVPESGWVLLCFLSSTIENRYGGYDWAIYKYQNPVDESALVFPGEINAVVGDTLQLFYRGMAKVINPRNFDFYAKCEIGAMYPRYFELTPTSGDVGIKTLYLQMRNIGGQILSSYEIPLNVVSEPSSPATEKRVLALGDSLTQAGVWPHELDRRLTSTDIATPTMPAGKGLPNIRFIGGMEYDGTRYFGVGGWGWSTYAKEGDPAFRFQVTGVTSIVKGAVYSNNGFQYTVMENNTTGGVGNILCSTSAATNVPSASGTLTKVSGSGDATITFASASADQQNPLWDGSKISFANYVSELGESGLDCVFILLGWNDIRPEQTDFSAIRTSIVAILSALHTDYPQAKAVLMGLQVPSLNGGMGANYGANGGYANLYGMIRAAFNYNKFLRELSEEDGYSSFVHYADVACEFDSENNMPQACVQVNTRNSVTEMRGTNGVHPSNDGQHQIADVAYRWFVANFC